MENPATFTDLDARGYTGAQPVAETRLGEAWRALLREVPSVPERISSGELTAADVVDVVCAAALRVLRNPDGIEQDSGSIDDYQESRRFADASSDVYFTAAELRRLQPAIGVPSAGSLKYS